MKKQENYCLYDFKMCVCINVFSNYIILLINTVTINRKIDK